jgi:hypothetical protein
MHFAQAMIVVRLVSNRQRANFVDERHLSGRALERHVRCRVRDGRHLETEPLRDHHLAEPSDNAQRQRLCVTDHRATSVAAAVVGERDFVDPIAQRELTAGPRRYTSERDERPIWDDEGARWLARHGFRVKIIRRANRHFDVLEPLHRHRRLPAPRQKQVCPFKDGPEVAHRDGQRERPQGPTDNTHPIGSPAPQRESCFGGEVRHDARDVQAGQVGRRALDAHVSIRAHERKRSQRTTCTKAIDPSDRPEQDSLRISKAPARSGAHHTRDKEQHARQTEPQEARTGEIEPCTKRRKQDGERQSCEHRPTCGPAK